MCNLLVFFVLFYVCIKGWYSGLLLFVETGCSVLSLWLGETFSFNGLRQIGLISFKWGSLFGALSVDSKQRISFGSSSVVYGILLLRQGCCSFNQYNLQDMILRLNFNPTLQMWIMPCVSKPTCTNVIIISLWLICHIQCGFSISYLSIPGIAARDRCNISHVFTFSFQF